MKVTLFCKSSECFLITWDQSECSTSSANIIDYYKIMVNGKHVNSTSEKSYKYIPQISGYTMYKFAVIACATNGLEGEIGEEVTCNSKKGITYKVVIPFTFHGKQNLKVSRNDVVLLYILLA